MFGSVEASQFSFDTTLLCFGAGHGLEKFAELDCRYTFLLLGVGVLVRLGLGVCADWFNYLAAWKLRLVSHGVLCFPNAAGLLRATNSGCFQTHCWTLLMEVSASHFEKSRGVCVCAVELTLEFTYLKFMFSHLVFRTRALVFGESTRLRRGIPIFSATRPRTPDPFPPAPCPSPCTLRSSPLGPGPRLPCTRKIFSALVGVGVAWCLCVFLSPAASGRLFLRCASPASSGGRAQGRAGSPRGEEEL